MITKTIAIAGLVGLLAALSACGGDGGEEAATTAATTAAPAAAAPTPTETAPATETPATPTPAPAATAPTATPTPAPAPTEAAPAAPEYDEDRAIGEVEGVTFVVAEGSEVTFTVEEQLTRLPLPIEAVMRTEELSGEFRVDGSAVTITVDLHSLTSDQDRRDQYVRQRMFRDHPTATFTVDGDQPLPDGFTDGEEVMVQVEGTLTIRGMEFPLTFDITARDDGNVVHLLGETTFTWADLGMDEPRAGIVVWVAEEVRVNVLLALKPLKAS